jgi:hypothetical protein
MHTYTPSTASSGTAEQTANARDIQGALEASTELRALPTDRDRVEDVNPLPEPTGRILSNMKTPSADLVLSSTRKIRGRQMSLFDRNAALFNRRSSLSDRLAALKADLAKPEADITALGVDVATLEADYAVFEADLTNLEADLAAYQADPAAQRE